MLNWINKLGFKLADKLFPETRVVAYLSYPSYDRPITRNIGFRNVPKKGDIFKYEKARWEVTTVFYGTDGSPRINAKRI